MNNEIFSLANGTLNGFKHLTNSFQLASTLETDLEEKDEWTGEDWVKIIIAGCYVLGSAYITYQNGKRLYNALTTQAHVENRIFYSPIPAHLYITFSNKPKFQVLKTFPFRIQ